MASNQIQQTGSYFLTGSFTASLGFDGTASYANKATRVDNNISSGDGIESFAYNGTSAATVSVDTSSAHFNAPINAITGSLVNSGSISGNTLTLHLGDGSTLANAIVSASYAVTASHALNSANADTDTYDEIIVTVLNYGGQDKFTINGLEAPTLTLSRAGTYRFNQSDATNGGHPLAFREIDDTSYTTGVTQVGTPGTAGAYTEIVVGFDTPVNLRYYCTVHGNIMGNLLNVTDMFDLSATGSLQGTATNANTASLATRNVITASATLNTITFTKGDGSTFNVSIAQSGSVATASFAETADFNGLINKPTLVSGSSQISYTGITDIPADIVSASAQVTLEDTAFTDGNAFSVLRTDGAGTIAFDFADRAYFNIRAGETLAKGDPLYVSGFNLGSDRVIVSKADANDPAKMPVIGLAAEALAATANGQGVIVGILDTIDTSTFTVGDELFVANGGGLTNTAPTGNDEVQTVGIVIRSDAANGRIAVAARMSSDAAASATVDTGSLLVTSSITNLTQSFTKGDGTTYTNLIDLSGSTITDVTFRDAVVTGSFSGSFTGEVSGSLTNAVTASFAEENVLTASAALNVITFTKGNNSTFDITVDTGSAPTFDTSSLLTTSSISGVTQSFTKGDGSTYENYITNAVTASFVEGASGGINFKTGFSGQLSASLGGEVTFDGRNGLYTQVSGQEIRIGVLSNADLDVNSVTANDAVGFVGTASWAQSASYAVNFDTASLITTASGTNNVLTFTKGDASTFDITVQTGSIPPGTVSSSAQLPSGIFSGSSQIDFITASSIVNAQTSSTSQANGLVFTKGDGTTINLLQDTSSFVKSVNTLTPNAQGNVAVTFGSVETGTSASMLAYSSSGNFNDADIWIISGESGSLSGSNGDTFIFASSSGQLLEISPTDQISNDARYTLKAGDTMTGPLILNADPTVALEAATKQYADTHIETASAASNVVTFTKGDGTTFDITVGSVLDTGSFVTTASVSSTTMSFTKGDGSTFDVTITESISSSRALTASIADSALTASFVTASDVYGIYGTSSVDSASFASSSVSASKVDRFNALSDLTEHADDDAAADAGIPIGGLYRNGNFVLIRIGGTGTDTHYLTGFSNTNFIDLNGALSGFLNSGGPWSFGFRSVGLIADSTDNLATMNRTGDGLIFYQRESATDWSIGSGDAGGSTGSTGWGTEPTQTSVAYWLFVSNGSGNVTAYYNSSTNASSALSFSNLPATPTGDITFGNSVNTAVEPWSVGASAIYLANTQLPATIIDTAAANNGIITTDANYGDVDAFITVGSSTITDQKGLFTSAAINGTLTFTSK